MCIYFIYINDNPAKDGYKIIIANNRDEFYDRPTLPADFWPDDSNCISGLDAEKGREGGTWLGVSGQGKIACLLNILTKDGPEPNKRGRGFLVKDYLTGSTDALTYLNNIAVDGHDYNGFNLVLIERSTECESDFGWKMCYYSNSSEQGPATLGNGIYGFSNSVFEKPFRKTEYGKKKFTEIINKLNKKSEEEALEKELLQMMHDRTSHNPDPQIEEQCGSDAPFLQNRGSVYVDFGSFRYGTRTTTLVFVDADNEVSYIESTMAEPITDQTWDRKHLTFSLDNQPKNSSL